MGCSVWLFFLFLIDILISSSVAQQPTYRYHICTNTRNYTANSAFPVNLNLTLASLQSNATGSNGFYNASTGQSLDRANGLFLCRGDISPELCQSCVKATSDDILDRCSRQKEAIIWYDECMLRYSNESIFSHMEEAPAVFVRSTNNVRETYGIYGQFNITLATLMKRLVNQAVSSSNFFAVGDSNLPDFTNNSIYGLVQCTPDITQSDCNICLSNCVSRIPQCCVQGIAGRVYSPSCNIRYEPDLFYTLASPPPTSPPENATPPPPPPAPSTNSSGNGQISSEIIIAITIPTVVFAVFVSASCYFLLTRRARRKNKSAKKAGNDILPVEALQFDFGTIQTATNRFLTDNKLGAGGFGEVYKGVLPNGQEIAVKRLSKRSGQGVEEFKNEVVVVAKLRHRNLVRLQGFCLEGEEKILVYEFVPNKSLDYFLYDIEKRRQLDWPKRYNIIGGIARGILYLHEDSPLRIIHRDLKASNVLLDGDMNPKIADFGMARIVGVDQTQGNTSKIVGTYGYMAPEYAMQGQFSVKSDVYSFGVLVLEIITGRKNSSFSHTGSVGNLLSYAWELWRDETPMQLLDSNLTDSYSRDEVLRCIHIGLLCVQEDPATRPTMTTVVHMLNTYSVSPPLPQQPAFFIGSKTELNMHISNKSTKSKPLSVDAASITELCPR